MGSWLQLFANSEVQVDNWLGKFGAIASHALIHNGFGVSSFLFVVLLFLVGLYAGFKIRLVSILSSMKLILFGLVWISVSLAYLFSLNHLYLGGKFGHYINNWLEASFGGIGAGMVIVFSLFTFAILRYNIPFYRIRNWVNGLMAVEDVKEDTAEKAAEEDWSQAEELVANASISEQAVEEVFEAETEEKAPVAEESGSQELEIDDTPIAEEAPAEDSMEIEINAPEEEAAEIKEDAENEEEGDENLELAINAV